MTVALPRRGHFGAAVVVGLAILAASSGLAVAQPVHIVAFGDSATYGWLVSRRDTYPAQLEAALRAKGYDVTVRNAGVSGATAREALAHVDDAVPAGTDIAIVEFGTNDLHRRASLKAVRATLTRLVRLLRARKIEVLVAGLGRLDLSGVANAGDAFYAQWSLPPGKYRARDHAHFNREGYAIIVARMLPAVERLIARGRAATAH